MSINKTQPIKNIIFDIGNVLVHWRPQLIMQTIFSDNSELAEHHFKTIFSHQVWCDLNLGLLSFPDAEKIFIREMGFTEAQATQLFQVIQTTLQPIHESHDLLEKLASSGFRIFILSDNIHEIVAHLKQQYDFWQHVEGAVISAEVNLLKPDPKIFYHLLDKYQLNPAETLFIDDLDINVQGAKQVGINAIQFTTPEKLRDYFFSQNLLS